jgi:hypothetical protein
LRAAKAKPAIAWNTAKSLPERRKPAPPAIFLNRRDGFTCPK